MGPAQRAAPERARDVGVPDVRRTPESALNLLDYLFVAGVPVRTMRLLSSEHVK
jgi:hypothetical protein